MNFLMNLLMNFLMNFLNLKTINKKEISNSIIKNYINFLNNKYHENFLFALNQENKKYNEKNLDKIIKILNLDKVISDEEDIKSTRISTTIKTN